MRIMLLGMLAVVGCAQLANDPTTRWPDHRKRHDTALEALETSTKQQAQEIALLRERIEKLELALRAATSGEQSGSTTTP